MSKKQAKDGLLAAQLEKLSISQKTEPLSIITLNTTAAEDSATETARPAPAGLSGSSSSSSQPPHRYQLRPRTRPTKAAVTQTVDSTLCPASVHFDPSAQVFVPPAQAQYVPEVASAPSTTSKQSKPKRLNVNQRRPKAAARGLEQSSLGADQWAGDLGEQNRRRASPVYSLGAQPTVLAPPSKLHQSSLSASLQPRTKQTTAAKGESLKRYINAPRVHMMERPLPSSLYSQLASQKPQLLSIPRPLLVILDLNGTLLKRSKFSGTNDFTRRPYVDELLTYLFANHRVMIWSSARPENVDTMCSDLFTPEQYKQLVAVWARDRLGLSREAYNAKVQVYKQLSWVWNDTKIQAANPNKEYMWTQANTVLIDDSIDKSASEPYNLVEVEEFMNQPEQVKFDYHLKAVIEYLKVLSYQADVSAYIKSQPFHLEFGAKLQDTMSDTESKALGGQKHMRFDD